MWEKELELMESNDGDDLQKNPELMENNEADSLEKELELMDEKEGDIVIKYVRHSCQLTLYLLLLKYSFQCSNKICMLHPKIFVSYYIPYVFVMYMYV